jgi:hypothetical protein
LPVLRPNAWRFTRNTGLVDFKRGESNGDNIGFDQERCLARIGFRGEILFPLGTRSCVGIPFHRNKPRSGAELAGLRVIAGRLEYLERRSFERCATPPRFIARLQLRLGARRIASRRRTGCRNDELMEANTAALELHRIFVFKGHKSVNVL